MTEIRAPQIPERMVLAAIGVSAGVLLAASLAIALRSEQQYRTQLQDSVGVQARILGDTSAAALAFDDRSAALQYVGALTANPETEAAGVYTERGRALGSFGGAPASLPPNASQSPHFEGRRVVVIMPVMQQGTRVGTVYLRTRAEPIARRLQRYSGAGLLVLMASLMFVMLGVYARRLSRVNQELLAQMAERERVEAALRQSQKMEAVGRLTGGIAHDFNNMLAIVIGSLDVLQRRMAGSEPRLQRLVEAASEGARRAADVTQRLLAFSRLQPLKPKAVDVGRAVNDLSALLVRTLGETVAIETVVSAGLWPAFIDQAQLESAILNLAINARDAMPDGGKLTIECSNAYLDREYAEGQEDLQPGQYVLVAVTDTGSGMAPDVLSQVFEPFYTTKPAGVGTGLGLSQVHGFIKQSRGHVVIYSEVGVGTTIKLYLPRSDAAVEATPVSTRSIRGRDRREMSVLIAEDEAGVREFAAEAAAELGFDALTAADAHAALALLEAHPEVKILLTDVVMPDVRGRELVDRALERRPDLGVIYMTGYTQNAIVHNGMLDPGTHLLTKPFTVAQLGRELDAALVRAETAQRGGPAA